MSLLELSFSLAFPICKVGLLPLCQAIIDLEAEDGCPNVAKQLG